MTGYSEAEAKTLARAVNHGGMDSVKYLQEFVTMKHWILGTDGELVEAANVEEWARWFEKSERQIARDEFGGLLVSTVFLGIDQGFGRGAPLLFETMILGDDDDEHQERTSTRAEALEAHARALHVARSRQPIEHFEREALATRARVQRARKGRPCGG